MRDAVLALFWLAAVPMTFINPAAGIVFWVWDALLSPTELAYSFMQGVETNKLIAITTLVSFALAQRRRAMFFDRTAAVIIAIVVLATGSYVFALVRTGLQDDLYMKLLKEVVLAFAIMYLITSKEWLYVVLLSVSAALGFMGVKEGLIALLTAGGHHIVGSRAVGDNNQLAAALISTVPLMLALWRCTPSRSIRSGLLAAVFLTIVTVIMTYSRGGFVGLIVLALLFLKGSRHRILSLAVIGVAAIALLNFAPAEWFSRVDTIQDASADQSFMGRVIAWKISWLIAIDNPIFGGGMHAVQMQPVWTYFSQNFGQLDWIPTSAPDISPHAAHSIYFEILGDLGFTGLLLYMMLFWIAISNCNIARRAAIRSKSMPWMIDFAEAVRSSIICYMVTGAALSMGYYELLFILVALSACCRRLAAQTVATAVGVPAAAPPSPARIPQAARMADIPQRLRFGAPR